MEDKYKTKEQLIEELKTLRGENLPSDESVYNNFLKKTHFSHNFTQLEKLSILNSVNDGIIVVDKTLSGLFINDRAKEILNLRSSEVLGKKILCKVVKNKSNAEVYQLLKSVLRTGKKYYSNKDSLIRSDNTVFNVNLSISPLISDGIISGLIFSFIDITKEKTTETKLKNERDNASKYFNTADALLLILNPDQTIKDINKTGSEILGYDRDFLIGKNWFDFFLPEETKELYRDEFLEFLRTPSFSSFPIENKPYKIICKDSVKYIKWSSSILYDSENSISGILNSGQDYTENIASQKILMHYQKIIAVINDPIALYDKSLNYVAVNNAYCKYFNKSKNELIGKNLKDNYPEDYYQESAVPVFSEALDGNYLRKQTWYNFPGVGNKFIDVTYYPVKNNIGEVQFLITTGKDLTNEKRAKDSLLISEQKYKTLVESSPTPIIVFIENKIVYSNNIANKLLLGNNKKSLLNKSIEDFIHPDYHKIIDNSQVDVLSDKNTLPQLAEEKFICSNGKILDVEVATTKIVFNEKTATQLFFQDISQRKKEEQEFRKTFDFHLTLFDDFPALIWRSDKDFNMNYFNKTWLNFTGRDVKDELGEGWMEGVHSDDLRIVSSYMYMFKRRESFELAYRHKRFDGEYRWLNNFGRPYYNIKGEFSGFIGACFDITARMNLEAALRESKEIYKQFFEEDLSANFVYNLNGEILECNQSFLDLFGITTKKEVSEINARELFISSTKFDEQISDIQINGKIASLENKKIKLNGDVFDTVENIVGIFDQRNKLIKIRTYLFDNTEQKKAQQELDDYKNHLEKSIEERTLNLQKLNDKLESKIRQEQAAETKLKNQISFLKTLLDSLPNPVFIKNRKKVLLDCNSAFERFFHIPKEEIIGTFLTDFPNEKCSEKFDNFESQLLKKATTDSIELEVFTDNTPKEILINELTFFRTDGSIGGLVGIITDITKQKKLQKEIRNAFQKEKELSNMKSRFISTASHEFRTPLTTILASADLLEMFGRDWKEEKYFEHTGKIQTAVSVMTELLDDVLVVSRAETGKLRYLPETINLKEFCSYLIEDAKIAHGLDHQIIFNYEYDNDFVCLDKKLIRYMLLNLLSNAIKYSPSINPITFEIKRINGQIQFVIKDQGIGIPDEDQQKLFEPFHRAENIGNISGTGLGLSIVYKSVELHKGKISFESKENQGTRFTINLPVEEITIEENCNN